MNLGKKITSLFLAIMLILGLVSQTVFAEETITSPLQYEIKQEVSEDNLTATISLTFGEMKTVQVEKVILPDGTEQTDELSTISYNVTENGSYEFLVAYITDGKTQEEKIPVEVTSFEKKSADEEIPEVAEEIEKEENQFSKLSMEESIYTVSTADEWKQTLADIEASTNSEATVMLSANKITSSNAKFSGIAGKHITVKSTEGNKYEIYLDNLVGDCTFDNVKIVNYNTIYANGHKAIFTENVDMKLRRLYGGSLNQDVDSTYVVVKGGHITEKDYSVVGGCNGGNVKGDVYVEIGGTAICEHVLTGGNINSSQGYVGGNVTVIYDRPTTKEEYENGKMGDIVNISGTYGTEIKGNLNIIVKSGYVKGIEPQRGYSPNSNVGGNIHVIAGDTKYENTDTLLRLVGNWSLYGAGSQTAPIHTYAQKHKVGGNVTIDAYENLWSWDGTSNIPSKEYPPNITGARCAEVNGNVTINAHGSHVRYIYGLDEERIADNVIINATDVELDDTENSSAIIPVEHSSAATGNATVNVNGGSMATIRCDVGAISGKTEVNVTGSPTFTNDTAGVWGNKISANSSRNKSILNFDKATTSIPTVGYFTTVNVKNASDITLGNEKKNAFANGNVYDVNINTDAKLTTENTARAVGALTMDNGSWTSNGYAYIGTTANTQKSNLTFNDYVTFGYEYQNKDSYDKDVVKSSNDTYIFNQNSYTDKIYGNADVTGSTWKIFVPTVIGGNYRGTNNKVLLPAFVDNENYPDKKIPLEILGTATGTTAVTLVDKTDTTKEGIPIVGQNYINALKVSEDVFELVNENAKPDGLYFKKLADADTENKNEYDMWQVAKRDSYRVIYDFKSGTTDRALIDDITDLLPIDATKYAEGSTVTAIQPDKTEIKVSDGVWMFKGYDADSKVANAENADNSRNIKFTGTWEFKSNSIPITPINAIPTIKAEDKTLTVGDKFDPLKDVTAFDKEDGDITKDVEVLSNDVDTSKAGIYTVTYKVTDSKGASVTKTIAVTVKAKDTQKSATDTEKKPASTDKQTTTNSPKTGDSTNMTTWFALMFVSFGLLAGVFTVRKSRKNR